MRRGPSAAPGHAGHARHRLRQQGGDRLRPDHGDRRALGRPHHRQARPSSAWARPRSTSTSTPPSSTRSCAPTCAIAGDARLAIEDLLPLVDKLDTDDWLKQIERLAQAVPAQVRRSAAACARSTCSTGSTHLGGRDCILTTDVGQHQMWAAQFCRDAPRTATGCRRGGAGTMGFGFPAAIGAQFAHPDKKVWAIVGDGGFQMTMCELATAALHKLPVKILIINNSLPGHGAPVAGAVLREPPVGRRPRRQPGLREAGRAPTASRPGASSGPADVDRVLEGGDGLRTTARASSTPRWSRRTTSSR